MPDQVKIKFGPARYNSPKALRNQIDDAKREAIEEAETDASGGNTFVTDVIGEQIVTPTLPLTTWLAPALVSVSTNSNFVNNTSNRGRIFFVPFVLNSDTPIDQIGVNIAVASTTSTLRLGIYSDVNGRPDTIVADGGSIPTTLTGIHWAQLSAPVTLPTGRYHVAVVFQDTAATTASISGRTITGPTPTRYHDHAGSAIGSGAATNPVFYTTAQTYTSGGLPANTSNGDILNKDVAGTGLSYYPSVAIRCGELGGFRFSADDVPFMYSTSPAVSGLTGPLGNTIYFIERNTPLFLSSLNLETQTYTASAVAMPAGITATDWPQLTHADNALWIIDKQFGGYKNDVQQTASNFFVYNGVSWTNYTANDIVNQAYGLTGTRTGAYVGMDASFANNSYGGYLWAVVSYTGAPDQRLVQIGASGVVGYIVIPTSHDVHTVKVRNGNYWVVSENSANTQNYVIHYDGSSWGSEFLFGSILISGVYLATDDGALTRIGPAGTVRRVLRDGTTVNATGAWSVDSFSSVNGTVVGSKIIVHGTSATSFFRIYELEGVSSYLRMKDPVYTYSASYVFCPSLINNRAPFLWGSATGPSTDERVRGLVTLPV